MAIQKLEKLTQMVRTAMPHTSHTAHTHDMVDELRGDRLDNANAQAHLDLVQTLVKEILVIRDNLDTYLPECQHSRAHINTC